MQKFVKILLKKWRNFDKNVNLLRNPFAFARNPVSLRYATADACASTSQILMAEWAAPLASSPSPSPVSRRATIESRHITLSEARSQLYQRRFSRPNTHFSAFFKIYKKIIFSRAKFAKFWSKIRKNRQSFVIYKQILQKFEKKIQKSARF